MGLKFRIRILQNQYSGPKYCERYFCGRYLKQMELLIWRYNTLIHLAVPIFISELGLFFLYFDVIASWILNQVVSLNYWIYKSLLYYGRTWKSYTLPCLPGTPLEKKVCFTPKGCFLKRSKIFFSSENT